MKICSLVDPMGTFDITPEDEYRQIKERLQDIFPEKFFYSTDVFPHQLENQKVDIYIIDFGGMLPGCEDMIRSNFRELVKQIDEKQSTLFIIWSAMTVKWYEQVIYDIEPNLKQPNVICRGWDEICNLDSPEYWENKVRKWFNIPKSEE